MSNGVVAREVDLLGEFYEAWKVWTMEKNKARGLLPSEQKDKLHQFAVDLAEAAIAIETYRKRNDRQH